MNKCKTRSVHKTPLKGRPFFVKLFVAMFIITILQLFIFLSVLLFGGEFSYIKRYAYNAFVEKNANRKSYIENMLTQKMTAANSSAIEIAELVDGMLSERSLNARDMRSSKELNTDVLSETSDILLSLLRQNQVNDVYMIIDSGELYSSRTQKKLSGIYIRDIDPRENNISNNEDLLMEMGNSNIASELGIVLDYEWAAQLDVTDNSGGNFDFYFNTLKTAEGHNMNNVYELGYWSGFTRISRSADASMKYTVPLITKDGTVYGVIGIGVTEKLIQDTMLAKETFGNDICYILGADYENSGEYEVQMHSGSLFARLGRNSLKINMEHRVEGEIYDFNHQGDLKTIGNIQRINLYNSASPFKAQKWALISIGEETGVMAIYNELVVMFVYSSIISIIVCLIGAVIVNRRMTAPVEKMIKVLNKSSAESGDIVSFEPSRINEIDTLGQAITKLQIDVRESASRVSKIIGMVDMGIGVFMYDYSKSRVYVGESLVKLLNFSELPCGEDVTISFDKFSEYLRVIDTENKVCSNSIFSSGEERPVKTDIELMYKDMRGDEKWLKFSLTLESMNVLGLVQDITASVNEKHRIEFERDYDITTGLLNRRAYLNILDELFSKPDKLKTAAIIMTDLDNLKYVNDTYGHDFGDDYIRGAANVLNEFSNYGGIVSRLSGDEFNVFLYGFDTKEEIRDIIEKIRRKMMRSYCLLSDGTKYKIRASGGISWYPDNSKSYDMLMKYADFAMYTIKHSTKGSIAEFDENEYKKDSILMTGVEEMNRIIDEERVRFAYQAIISAKSGEVIGYELLMRPQSEILKSPLDLIRIAKSSSKLYEIERLTWLKGLEGFSEQIKKGNIAPDSKAFVNSLASCIVDYDNTDFIEREYGAILNNIMMEMLESETENEVYTSQKLKTIKRWEAGIALDDFGTGYNSEYLFMKLSPDLIKIDRSIISGCDKDQGKVNIINNLIRMAKNKNAAVLAEGVETHGELKRVIECGADYIQGYYITRPVFEPQPIKAEIIEDILSINEK